MIHKTITICCLLFCCVLIVTAQDKVRYLSIDQGLANNTTTCIFKDRQGFMWFGTYDGLNRYDGYVFKKYNHIIGDSTSLAGNMVYAIAEDNDNRHWIAAGPGVSVLDNQTAVFSPVNYLPFNSNEPKIALIARSHSAAATKRLEAIVNCISNDGHGNMLVGANQAGLIVFRKGELTGRQLGLPYQGKMLSAYSVLALFNGREGQTWFSVKNTGIFLYDHHTGSVVFKHQTTSNVNCFALIHKDTLLAAGNNSLLIMSDSGLSPYKLDNGKPFHPGRIMSLCHDQAGRLWIATDGNGISIIDEVTHRPLPLTDVIGHQTITSNAIYCIYKDDQERKWIGTFRGGVNMIDHGKEPFYSVKPESDSKNSPANNFIFSFCEDKDGDIWVGTDGAGISLWNRKSNVFKNYRYTQEKNGLTSDNISDMEIDNDGNIWIATYGGGILRFLRNSKTFQKISATKDENISRGWQLYKDNLGDIWAGCGKLFKYDKMKGELAPLNNVSAGITALTGERNGHLWIGRRHNFQCIDKKGKSLFTYNTNAPVRSILEASNGVIWVGTQGNGLLKFDRGRCKIYTEQHGLPNNNVLNILEDDSGAIWMSTFNGISRFTPGKEHFENFFDVDGLQSNQFYYNAALKLTSGELLFGGIKGFTIFRPETCIPKKTFPALTITGIRILNEELKSLGNYVKGTSLYAPDKIEVPYSKAVLSIDFAALEYSLPRKIQYAYFLEGWDKTWSLAGSLKTANYSELREGNYVLRIKSTNASGIWNPKELRLPVHVLPPWYRTWWARVIAILILLGLAGVLLYYWEKHRRIKYKMKIAELKHQHEMDLNEKRLSFFTNISHEFRSPLTLIINPIKEILKNGPSSADSYNFGVLYSNAQRLLKITDQLLLFRKADNEFGKIELVKSDLLNLCRQVYFCFSDEAALKSLTYEFDCGLQQAEVYADPEKIEMVLFNLISNAIKFSPDKGCVTVKLEAGNDEYIVSVRDNGPGIPKDIGDKLFRKFYQVPDEPDKLTTNRGGFGVGLYLAKAFADMHNASLSYACHDAGGTIFTFSLKKAGNDSLASSEANTELKAVTEKMVQSDLPVHAFLTDPATCAETVVPGTRDNQLNDLVTEKKVMLVIDNDRQLTAYIKHLFGHFTVYEAENVSAGWKKVQEQTPDIIICDIVMEESTGIEFCKKVKSSSSYGHIPVILLTGCSSGEIRLQGAECGADDYILKPFESDLLLARVNSILKDREVLKKFFFNAITLQSDTLKVSDEFRGFLGDCIAIVEENIERDDFDSKVFAKKMSMSRSKLYVKVKAISGLSVNEFVKLIRLRKAAGLMIHTDGQVKEIAFQVGFNDPKYFSEQFARLFQLKPSEYIKKYRNSFQNKTNLNRQFSRAKNTRNK